MNQTQQGKLLDILLELREQEDQLNGMSDEATGEDKADLANAAESIHDIRDSLYELAGGKDY